MKFNIEVEIDWIDEDCSLDSQIEQQIKESIIKRVELSIVDKIKPQIDDAFKDSVQNQTDKILTDYLSKPVVVSNGYKKEEHDSALEMIEQRFSLLYDKQFSGSSCEGDMVMKKLNEKIALEVRNTLSKVNRTIETEAKKIAASEIEESSLYAAMKKIGGL